MSDGTPAVSRRALLGALAGAGGASLAGCSVLQAEGDDATEGVEDNRARRLAERFAPELYFDRNERWFPTDPRPYEKEGVVDGFDALEGYTERVGGDTVAPDPTVFYNVIEYERSPLAVVQFWYYSVFDQFATNFHWHDWEVVHAFVDTGGESDAAEPQLYVASSHSRKVPNNEYLDPDPGENPRVLSELGSHSSALSFRDERFQRFSTDDAPADITNSVIETVEELATVPLAYGLPRDEGLTLPYLVPELDGEPIYRHERLPSVERSDLIDEELTVRSFAELTAPPSTLPGRENGLAFGHAGRNGGADVEYELAPTSEIEHIESFTGPQLSFEFEIPEFAEDGVATHITSAGLPWEQDRYGNPAADISEPSHRRALARRYEAIGEPAPVHQLVAAVRETVTAEDAPDGGGVATEEPTVETVALLQSEPRAVPTFAGGVVAVEDPPEGDHRLTVNGAGLAPHSERVSVPSGAGTTAAGAGGEIPLVARGKATKLTVDTEGVGTELTELAVEDDFAGRLYDSPLSGPDAVYVHQGGAYTTEVRDIDGAVGAFRINPEGGATVGIDRPRTGKASLASYLADVADETRADISEQGSPDRTARNGETDPVTGLARALEAVAAAARRAAQRAEAGDRGGADRSIETVQTRLERVSERLAAARGAVPEELARATDRRLDQARRRARQARSSEKL